MKNNKTFETFKSEFITACKNKGACEPEFKRVLLSNNFTELLQVIKDNYSWCMNNELFSKEDIIRWVDNETLISNGFYYDYTGVINGNVAYVYDGLITRVMNNATIQDVRGNATIQDVWGNATIQNVRGNATIQNVWDNATIQNVRDNATIQDVWDNAIYRIMNYNSKPKLFMKKDAYEIVLIP